MKINSIRKKEEFRLQLLFTCSGLTMDCVSTLQKSRERKMSRNVRNPHDKYHLLSSYLYSLKSHIYSSFHCPSFVNSDCCPFADETSNSEPCFLWQLFLGRYLTYSFLCSLSSLVSRGCYHYYYYLHSYSHSCPAPEAFLSLAQGRSLSLAYHLVSYPIPINENKQLN